MRHIRLVVALVALLPTAGLAAPKATVSETRMAINSYPFSDPDPVPATEKW